MEQTLVLNVTFEPLKVVDWQRAITLWVQGKAEILADPDRFVVRDAQAPLALLDQRQAGNDEVLWAHRDPDGLAGERTEDVHVLLAGPALEDDRSRPGSHHGRFVQIVQILGDLGDHLGFALGARLAALTQRACLTTYPLPGGLGSRSPHAHLR